MALVLFALTALGHHRAFARELLQTQPSGAASAVPAIPLTLADALEMARRNFPSIKESLYRSEAAQLKVRLEKTSYLPRGSMLVQEMRGTSNQTTGPLLPNSTFPPISGAEVGGNDLTGGWGCATGAFLTWEPFDFGLRAANVAAAQAESRQSSFQADVSELEAEVGAAEAFLRASAAQEALRASQALLERMAMLKDTVRVLFDKHLRSNTDVFMAQAEEARAKDQVIEAEQALDLASCDLCGAIGLPGPTIRIESSPLLEFTPESGQLSGNVESHPVFLVQASASQAAANRKKAIEKSYYPRVNLIAAIYGRGSSFKSDVSINEAKGFYPTRVNYAAGFNITFPFLDIFELKARRLAASKIELAERAQLALTGLKLSTDNQRAEALMKGALKLAENAPVKVEAARQAANSARVRYQIGLSSINDVALDEQLLKQAEVEQSTARLRVWRAFLAQAAAKGNIELFLLEIKKTEKH